MPGTLLLVEDDEAVAQPLRRALEREGYAVEHVVHGLRAVDHVLAGGVDAVLLDVELPDVDGLEVCRRLREAGSDVAVLMLTSRSDELDRVVGLDSGADDYLGKPFGLAELFARLRALHRRGRPHGTSRPASALDRQGLRVDATSRQVFVHDREVVLSPKEFDVLAALWDGEGAVVRREALVEQVWQTTWYGSTKTLDVTVSRLRRKLRDHGLDDRIVTLRGVGFRLDLPEPS